MKTNKESFFKFFLSFVVINFILISLAVFFYNGEFETILFPLSSSGTVFAENGLSNTTSMYLYCFDMIISGVMLIFFAMKQWHSSKKTNNLAMLLLLILSGGGFLIASFSPDDIRHSSHVLGSAIAIAGLWIITTSYLFEVREKISQKYYYFLQAMVQIPIVSYAIYYFSNGDPASYAMQKIALVCLCYSMLSATWLKDKHSK
jgi:hypothetical protein